MKLQLTIHGLIDKAKENSRMSFSDMAKELDRSNTRISEWRSGKAKPEATEVAWFAEKAGLRGIEVFEAVAEIERQLRPEYADVWTRAVDDWRKRSNPPKRKRKARDVIPLAPIFGGLAFVALLQRRMPRLVNSVDRALYAAYSNAYRLRYSRHRLPLSV